MKWRYEFKVKPAPYQLQALKNALKAGKYGIFFQQRVGKTRVALDFCGVKNVSEGIRRVLIVCPLSVRGVWEEQIGQYLSNYRVIQYPYGEPKIKNMYNVLKNTSESNGDLDFVIINYDRLSVEAERILRWKPEIVIFDESHLVKNHSSKRSRSAYRVAKVAPYRLLLTGTPIPKKPHDIFSQFRVMDDTVFGTRWQDFKSRYCVEGGYMGKEIVGYKNTEELSRLISEHSIRVLREDVMQEPEVENIILPVEFESKAHEIYSSLKKQFVAELDSQTTVTADMAGVRIMRLQQVCGGFTVDDVGTMHSVSTAKLDATFDLLNTLIDGGESVIVFHRFSAEGDALADRLNDAKIPYGCINGKTKEDLRKANINAFNSNNIRVLIVQIATGCMGIDLSSARTAIYFSLDFSLSNYLQARDRIMGRNQKSNVVTNYFIAVKGTVDYKVMKTLKDNEDLASEIANKWRWLMDD